MKPSGMLCILSENTRQVEKKKYFCNGMHCVVMIHLNPAVTHFFPPVALLHNANLGQKTPYDYIYVWVIQTNSCCHSFQGPIQEQREIATVIQRCYKRYKQVRSTARINLWCVLCFGWFTIFFNLVFSCTIFEYFFMLLKETHLVH